MPRTIDCFTFYNENDVLEIRLQELYPVVDKFVIIQASETFRGHPKPDYFDYDRFAGYMHKIDLYDIGGFGSENQSTWDREIFQRNYIMEAIGDRIDDTIIISDVDEIPRRSVVQRVDKEYRLLLDKYSYAINMLTNEGNSCVRILPYRDIAGRTAEQIRRGHTGEVIANAGWEFSSLGTAETVLKKLRSFAHDEFDHVGLETIAENMRQGKDFLGRDIGMTPVEIDDTFPQAIKTNPEYWSKFLWTSV